MTKSMLPRLLVLLTLLALAFPALGAEFRHDTNLKIPAEETIKDDLYAVGETITIDGIVEGDLIAFAKDIIINGEVRGDVIAAAQTIEASGTLGDDVRVAGQALKFGPKAKIGGDVIAGGMSLETEKGSTIAGDFIFGGYQALLAGQIDKDLLAGLANLQLAGKVGGDAEVFFESDGDPPPINSMTGGQPVRIQMPQVPGGLTLENTAEVDGKLKYTSKRDAKIDEAAKVTGGVSHEVPQTEAAQPNAPPPPPQNEALALFYSRLRHFLCAAMIGLVVFLVLPKSSLAWADNIRTRPFASLAGGILGFIGFFILAIGLFFATIVIGVGAGAATLTELVPTVIFGGTIGVVVLCFVFVIFVFFLGQAVVGLALGRLLLRKDNFGSRLIAFLVGLLLVTLLLSIPKAGLLMFCLVFLFGLGGYTLWLAGFEPVTDTVPPTSPPPRPTAPIGARPTGKQ
jgi:cytoskeletal protein CcmA (bactofilin family)